MAVAGGAAEAYEAGAEALLAGLTHADVLAAMSPQLPTALVAALLRTARRRDVTVTLRIADLTGRWAFIDDPALADIASRRLRLVALAGAVPGRLAGLVDHLAVSLWDIDRLISGGRLPVDVFVERVGFTGERDRLSHGDMLGFSTSALNVAARVGFEVAPRPRRHCGDEGIPAGRADVMIRTEPLGMSPGPRAPSPVQQAIGRHLAALVPDGATLQLGLGGAPAAAISHLIDKVDLGLHSGILPGEVQGLIARGVITGRRKTRQSGQHVATGLLGGQPGAWGSGVLLEPLAQTHHPGRLLEHENLWAINSAFEVDLTGQANAEYVGETRIASGAGQIDFARAAHASPAGASVIALPARSSSGAPRIIGCLTHPVTLGGSDVDFVVTEYGVAQLRGRTADERGWALTQVAHPQDRRRLGAAAHSLRTG